MTNFAAHDADSIVTFRIAAVYDLDPAFDLITAATTDMDKNGIFQWCEYYPTKEIVAADIAAGELYVGELDRELCCIFTLNQTADEEYCKASWHFPEASFFVIHRLCVSPAFQHHGIGRQAMAHIEELSRKAHIETLRLDVFSQNPHAIRLYTRNGFYQTGEADWRMGRFYLMEKKL